MHIRYRIAAVLAAICLIAAAIPLTVFAAYENTHTNTGNQPADLIAIAKTQLGYAEGSDNYNKYGESFGNANAAWCGYFISWCARQAGIPTSVIPTTGSSTAFFDVGTYHSRTSGYQPQPGDIMLYGVEGDSYHASIVERFDTATSTVHVIDGNWSDQVSSHSTTLSNTEVAGFATPHYTSEVTELTAFNMVTPEILAVGSGYSISGFICSPNDITEVTVTIIDEENNVCIEQSAAPNAKTYELSALDATIKFGELDVGVYSYTVTATDTVESRRWTYIFEVVSEVEMQIDGVVVPTAIDVGKAFSIYGSITCPEPLLTVSVSVYDLSGTYKTGGTANPNTTTYDIHGVDNYVSFGKLEEGYYILTVAARSAHGAGRWEYPFTVGDPEPLDVTFVLTDVTLPATVVCGEDVALSGTVSATEELSDVTLTLTDENGTACVSATAAPNATAFHLAALDETFDVSGLQVGSYTYVLRATSASGSQTWDYPLTVEAAVQTVDFALSGAVTPTVLSPGSAFSVYGTVSASKPLTDVTVSVIDSSGAAAISASATPNAGTFDIHTLDASLTFGKLSVGDYVYTITATAAGESKTWKYPFSVTGNVSFTLTDAVVPTHLEVGAACSISGTVTSTQNLTTVSITVTDAADKVCLSASASPGTGSYRLGALDTQLKFGTLSAGVYRYKIYAEAGGTSKEWVYTFTVGDVSETFGVGDVTMDGAINNYDVVELYNYVSGSISFSQTQIELSGSESPNMLTVVALYEFVAGISTTYP